jgi:hypothetical protein
MPVADLQTIEYKLGKRGFKRDDVFWHECKQCNTQAVAIYLIGGKTGGRQIHMCHECGHTQSWRAGAGLNEREEDVGFDLRKFLG